MINEVNYISEGLQQFVNSPYGAITIRIMMVFIIGEASRIVSYEFFGFVDSIFKDKYTKAFKRLSSFVGYVVNIYISIKLAQIFRNGHSDEEAIGWGIIYGSIAIVLHVVWVKLDMTKLFLGFIKFFGGSIFVKIKGKLKLLGQLLGLIK